MSIHLPAKIKNKLVPNIISIFTNMYHTIFHVNLSLIKFGIWIKLRYNGNNRSQVYSFTRFPTPVDLHFSTRYKESMRKVFRVIDGTSPHLDLISERAASS